MFRTMVSAAMLVVLAACSSSGSGSSDAGASGDGPRTAEAGRNDGRPAYDIERYVALGDSYTAAPLIAGKMSNDGCFRSSNNYPSLVAAELDGATFVDRSCGGATTRDMAARQDTGFGRVPPQFSGLTADTDLVTIGIGGNDFGVFGSLIQGCPGLRKGDPTGSPCRDYFSGGGRDELLARATRVQGRVAGVLRQIETRAPDATVVVVDYPRITPRSGTCPRLLPLATGDYGWVGQVERPVEQVGALGGPPGGCDVRRRAGRERRARHLLRRPVGQRAADDPGEGAGLPSLRRGAARGRGPGPREAWLRPQPCRLVGASER